MCTVLEGLKSRLAHVPKLKGLMHFFLFFFFFILYLFRKKNIIFTHTISTLIDLENKNRFKLFFN